jgi:hypothetical protein
VLGRLKETPVLGRLDDTPVLGRLKETPVLGRLKETPVLGRLKETPVLGRLKETPVLGRLDDTRRVKIFFQQAKYRNHKPADEGFPTLGLMKTEQTLQNIKITYGDVAIHTASARVALGHLYQFYVSTAIDKYLHLGCLFEKVSASRKNESYVAARA